MRSGLLLLLFILTLAVNSLADDEDTPLLQDKTIQHNFLEGCTDSKSSNAKKILLTRSADDYYSIKSTYSTALSLKTFKNSKEYLILVQDFDRLKKETISKKYFLQFGTPLSDYDLKTKSFHIRNPLKMWKKGKEAIPVDFYFPSLQNRSRLTIPMSKEKALKVERESAEGNITGYIIFKLDGTVKHSKISKNGIWCLEDEDGTVHFTDAPAISSVLQASDVRLIVCNDSTGEIYFDQNFPEP